jgi:predicted ATPase
MCSGDADAPPELKVAWDGLPPGSIASLRWQQSTGTGLTTNVADDNRVRTFLSNMRVYSLDPVVLPRRVQLRSKIELASNGDGLSGVLDRLRDDAPERFEALNEELGRWLPEFDRILFDTPQEGHRAFRLRTRIGNHSIPADELSQGTLLALTMLTLAYLPQPPSLIGLEEPDRGIHPRLLREVRDALYRLAYPESFGETRPPVQVVATTQSPYFLDLFREHPEEIVIAEKKGLEAEFVALTAHPHIEEILADAPLGEVWYSGVLGGVPVPS